MASWSITNRFRKVSYEQFMEFAREFHAAVNAVNDTETKLDVLAFSTLERQPVGELTQAQIDETNALNQTHRLLKADNLEALTEELWNSAEHVRMRVLRQEAQEDMPALLASIETSAKHPKVVACYEHGGKTSHAVEDKFLLGKFLKHRIGYQHINVGNPDAPDISPE